jgi:alpha-L-fucosidase
MADFARQILASLLLISVGAFQTPAHSAPVATPPVPYAAVPSPQHMEWQRKEIIAFTHFGVNTFTNSEWGSGKEDPQVFNPTSLNCDQWITALKAAGVREVILTCKHHDGFCLWPSAYTLHSVKGSPWKNGKGDVVQEFSDACKRGGVEMGVYLSPWDRNSPYYGNSPVYNTYYENQLAELLTHYGDIHEVWMDGANGEGPNGKKQEYDFPAFSTLVHRLAPNAVIFQGDPNSCPCVRWVGHEAGHASETDWGAGTRGGKQWMPAETDVSIRPGWFYHASEDDKVKSLDDLLNIYYASVGHGSVLLLNVPPDPRGLIATPDVERLKEFGTAIKAIFSNDLATNKPVSATNVRANSNHFSANNVTHGGNAYWATDDSVKAASLTVHLGKPTAFNNIVLQEYLPLGQRIAAFTVDGNVNGSWQQIGAGTTIGYKRILWIPRVSATDVRINVTDSDASPVLSHVGLYNSPFDAPVVPSSLIAAMPATASNVHGNQTEFGADKAVDGNPDTRWATDDGTKECWLEVDAQKTITINKAFIAEFEPRITSFRIEYKLNDADTWQTALSGTKVGVNYTQTFPPVQARYVRLHILDATNAPTIWEFQVFGPSAK